MVTRKRLQKRLEALREHRSSWLSDWRDIDSYLFPKSSRFLASDANRAPKRSNKIYNNAPTYSVRTCSAGMHAGVTSPARPWFRLGVPDPDLQERESVKIWLGTVEVRMRDVFHRSNAYNAFPVAYTHMPCFGIAAGLMQTHIEEIVRFSPYPVGSYMLAAGSDGSVNALFREMRMSVDQLVEKFGLSKVSKTVANAHTRGDYDTLFDVCVAVEPRLYREPGRIDRRNKPWAVYWWETGTSETDDKLLDEGGFDEQPFYASRWDVTGEDVYGTGPGWDVLPDVKALQQIERRKLQLLDKLTNPSLQAPAVLKATGVSQQAGEVTWVSGVNTQIAPTYVPDPRALQLCEESVQKHEFRVSRAFYEDLFLMLAMSDRREVTAREIEEKHEEKMLQLGPVLERVHNEMLSKIIDRVFGLMLRAGLIPPPPPELQGVPLRIEYISIMAQAQKLIETARYERLMGFIAPIVTVSPSSLDVIDVDQTIQEYGQLLGVAPRVVRDDDGIAAIRKQRELEQKLQQLAALAPAARDAATAAKTMSEVPPQNGAQLARMIGGAA